MEEVRDAIKMVVELVLKEVQINVLVMEEVKDVLIVLIGLIQEVVPKNMTDIVQLVLKENFQMILAVLEYMITKKRQWYVTLLIVNLKDLFIINQYIHIIVIVHIEEELIIEN